MRFHKQILSTSQFKLLERLGPFLTQHGFYLGGGTAIALMLGHRKSVDLDWFSEKPIGDPNSWVDAIKKEGIRLNGISADRGTLHAIANGIRISLLEYRYPMVRSKVEWKGIGCMLASLDDLTCMKLSAIVQRGSKKDFIDIYALMKKHNSLQHMVHLYQKKFPGTDIFPVLKGLSYFDEAEKERAPRVLWKVTWPEMKKDITTAMKNMLP